MSGSVWLARRPQHLRGSHARSPRSRASRAPTHSRGPWCRRRRSPRREPGRRRRTAPAPHRTARPTRSHGVAGSARSSCDPASGWRRSRAWRRPRRSAARSAATTARRARSYRATARPSSPDRARPGPDHCHGRLPPASATRCDGPPLDLSFHSVIRRLVAHSALAAQPGESQGRPQRCCRARSPAQARPAQPTFSQEPLSRCARR